jgi:predicted alpha/beta superfamily hydrolase
MRFLQLPGENALPQILCVGIGYRTESLSTWRNLRTRDLTPTQLPEEKDRPSGGAAKFLRFIREELMPFVKQNYRASSDASYAGGSYGGLFGLYTLFHEPETFQRYIIISPSIGYDSRVTMEYEADYAMRHSDLPARIFMSVGGLEQQEDTVAGMITDMKQLVDKLRGRQYSNLRLETVVFDEETHLSGIAAAISRGLRVIYQK